VLVTLGILVAATAGAIGAEAATSTKRKVSCKRVLKPAEIEAIVGVAVTAKSSSGSGG